MSIIKKVINKLFPEGTKRRKFIRVIARGIKSINLTNIKKFFKMVKMYGFKYAIFLVGEKLDKTNRPEYELWIRANEPKKFELEAQKKHKFKYEPKISLVVPMYNTPVKYFEELVDSLIRQTYSNWELCLADGSPEKNSKIEKIAESHSLHPELREAHKALAREIITDLHGKEEYDKAVKISEALFSGNIKELSSNEIEIAFKNVPHYEISNDKELLDVLIETEIATSKREAREFVNGGAISINGDIIKKEDMVINFDLALDHQFIVIRRGKKKYYLIKIV